jgi:hypothetical protein
MHGLRWRLYGGIGEPYGPADQKRYKREGYKGEDYFFAHDAPLFLLPTRD